MITFVKVRKVGHSLAILLPRVVTLTLRVRAGDQLHVTVGPDGVRLSPFNPLFAAALYEFDSTRRFYRNALRELAQWHP